MTDDPAQPPAPRSGPTWPAPADPPVGPGPWAPAVPSPAGPKKRRPVLTHGAVAVVALFIGVGIGNSAGASNDGKGTASATTTSPVTTAPTAATPSQEATTAPATEAPKPTTTKPKPSKKAGPATSFDGDGEYLVGEDIAAGTYKTAGSADDFGCYWERDKDSSGEFSSIIANDNLNGSGRVTVHKGEIFKTERCQTWKKVG